MRYLESSALLKLYVLEPGSPDVEAAVRADPLVVSSLIAALEVRAAFAAAARNRRLPDVARAVAEFRRFWATCTILAVNEARIDAAAQLAERHALRANDALHLASALFAAQGDPAGLPFGSFDDRLNRAAAAEGLPLLF